MNKIEVCNKVKKMVRQIIVDNGSKILSTGTGVVIREDGTLVTARHVVEGDDGVYHGRIRVRGSDSAEKEYIPAIVGLNLDINFPDLVDPLIIDLTILKPAEPQKEVEFINICNRVSEVGTDVLIAGYPDDISLPFHFDKKLSESNPEMQKVKEVMEERFKFFFRQLMCKSAMIGHVQNVKLGMDVSKLGIEGVNKIHAEGAVYWLDNHLTYGGSGGPIVNLDGELLGVICEKAFTESKMESVDQLPSGTGMGLSHQLITWLLPHV